MRSRVKADVSLAFKVHVRWVGSGAAYGDFMHTVEVRRASRRERVSKDRGNPLDTLNDFIEFYSRYKFRWEDLEIAQELNPVIEPVTEWDAAISAVNQVILDLRYYAISSGTLLNLDKSK